MGVEEGVTDICSNFCCCSHWTLEDKYYHFIVYRVSKRGCTTYAPVVHHHMSKTVVNRPVTCHSCRFNAFEFDLFATDVSTR